MDNKKIKCDECSSEFSYKKNLYAHVRKFHKKDLVALNRNPTVKCNECESDFTHKKHLYAHLRKVHKKDVVVRKKNLQLKCEKCAVEFSQKKNFHAHVRNIHEKALNTKNRNKDPDFECKVCKKKFSEKSSLMKHVMLHKKHSDHTYASVCYKKSKLLCSQGSCVASFLYYENFRNHLSTDHNIKVEEEYHEFTSLESFENWKEELQQRDITYYSLDSAPKKLSCAEAWNLFYNCHRSYSYVPTGKNIRSLKSMGSNKIGKACPSRMRVTRVGNFNQPSLIKVRFWKTHVGHDLQLGHVSLDSKTRAEIAGKLKEGVSFNHILDTIRDNVVHQQDVNQRLSILERRDLHNIVTDFSIDYGTKRHQNDAVSVKLWVSEMQQTESNPVLYYKGQDEKEEDNSLEDGDFVLIIMTPFQADQLVRFGKNKICIDGTHGTNAYDIQLYTIMSVDEFGSGCPVAYCFSNRCDQYIFVLFFDQMKQKVGAIDATVFMSDAAPAFYNAWKSVMGEVENQLLCSWHVDRNWRSNLNKIGHSDKKL